MKDTQIHILADSDELEVVQQVQVTPCWLFGSLVAVLLDSLCLVLIRLKIYYYRGLISNIVTVEGKKKTERGKKSGTEI